MTGRTVKKSEQSFTRSMRRSKNEQAEFSKRGHSLSFEQCFTHILDSLKYIEGPKKRTRITPKQKQHFREIEKHPERLELSQYPRIVRDLINDNLSDVRECAGEWAKLIDDEIHEFLFRYENLAVQIANSGATARQTLWSLTSRFFIPWLALRLAFNFRQKGFKSRTDVRLFLPQIHDGKIGSCFLAVVDAHIRLRRESDYALAHRLSGGLSPDKREFECVNLQRDLRRCRSVKISSRSVSDGTIRLLASGSQMKKLLLILARAVDRNVKDAANAFGSERALEVVRFFDLCFTHFGRLFKDLAAERPRDDGESWGLLQSRTITGNTPFEADRFYPLIDRYMNELARCINRVLASYSAANCFPPLPVEIPEVGVQQFPPINWRPIPPEIERPMGANDFGGALEASQTYFGEHHKSHEMASRVGRLFCDIGMMSFRPDMAGRGLVSADRDALNLIDEGIRLLRFAYASARGKSRSEYAEQLLRVLLQPHRPKRNEDRKLARKLFPDVESQYRKKGRAGSTNYLLGCLFWMEGNNREATRAFLQSEAAVKESCGEDWVSLLRLALVQTESVSRRAFKRFAKLAELYGVFSGSPAPRTDLLATEMNYQTFANSVRQTFREFPRLSRSTRAGLRTMT